MPVATASSPRNVLLMADVAPQSAADLVQRYGIDIVRVAENAPIRGSFWGAPEAGIAGCKVYVRPDTPVHSFLHETCHIVCMAPDRRAQADGNAGSDDIEEAAVCYLQVLLADQLPGVGRDRLMRDMDAWGYSFRLGSTRRWFENDAGDAHAWLARHELLSAAGQPVFRLRCRRARHAAQYGDSGRT